MRSSLLLALGLFVLTAFGCVPQDPKTISFQDPDNPGQNTSLEALIRENRKLKLQIEQNQSYRKIIETRLDELKATCQIYEKKYYDTDDMLKQSDKRNQALGEYIRDLETKIAKLKNKLNSSKNSNSNSKK